MKDPHSHRPESIGPPAGAFAFLRWFCAPDLVDEIAGDLEAQYHRSRIHHSKWDADLRFWLNTLLFFRPAFLRNDFHTFIPDTRIMWASNFRVASRHLRRHSGFTSINVFGLAVGMTCCLLAWLYVTDEISYDRFHSKGDRIYRVGTNLTSQTGSTGYNSTVDWPVGRILRDRLPAIESVLYLRNGPERLVLDGDIHFRNQVWAEETFTDLFDFPMLRGDQSSALDEPYTAVLSETTAQELYGRQDVIGETFLTGDSLLFTVSGVMEVPRKSHIQFDILLSFATFKQIEPEFYNDSHWLDLNMINYVLLRDDVDPETVEAAVAPLMMDEIGELLTEYGYSARLALEPLKGIYLGTDRGNNLGPTGNMTYVRLLGLIGLFILGVAGVNFINLTTARSMERAREVGVRKYVGASNGSLVRQFMSEALLVSLLSVVLAMGMTGAVLPAFNSLAGTSLGLSSLFSTTSLPGIAGLWLTVGLAAGLYPSILLSRTEAVRVLRGSFSRSRSGNLLRRSLVVFQFSVSAALIVGTLVIQRQVGHMMNAEVGFDREQVLAFQVGHVDQEELQRGMESLQASIGDLAGVQAVTATNAVPGRSGWRSKIVWPEGLDRSEGLITEVVTVDPGFLATMGLDLVTGRDFRAESASDPSEAVLINETAVQEFGWASPEEALGKFIDSPSHTITHFVVGVVQDYHHHSLKERIRSIVYVIQPSWQYVAVRAGTDDLAGLARGIEEIWDARFPDYAFSEFFLDDDFDRQYAAEQRVGHIVSLFTLIAIVISCLGLFSLAAYSTLRRTREIGIRRVMGATVPGIVGLLSREFLALVGLALAIGIPVALILTGNWLQSFPDPIRPGPGLIAIAALGSLGIAFLTVGIQSVRAALVRPVESIRSE